MKEFSGKTVLVTGAAGGIGQVMLRCFAEAGARVAALDRNEAVTALAESLSSLGFESAAAVADLRDEEALDKAFATLRERLGPVAVLVNNAGFSGASTLESTSPQTWHADIDVNLGGAFRCTVRTLDDMKAAGGGAIVNIGSVNGLTALGDPAYSAAKAGLIAYTKALALEYGRFAIRANVICPGTVRTPIWDHRIARKPEVLDDLVKWYPLRRIADPIDIARAALFLASDAAAAITGAVLPVDCGLSAGNIQMARDLTLADF